MFPAPARSSYSPARIDAPELGGERHAGAAEVAAAAGMLVQRPHPEIDQQRSAALRRYITEVAQRGVRLRGSKVATSGQTTLIGLGGPETGFTWSIRRINVGPLDYSAGSFPTGIVVIAAIATKISSNSAPDSAYEVVSMTTTFPAEGTWGKDELQLQASDRLQLLITGLATGVTVTAGGFAQETAANLPERYQV